MALKAKKQKLYTPEEYLKLEEKADFRSEYDDGIIVAMAGGSINHARIIRNIDRAFGRKLNKNCESFTTDIRVRVQSYKKFYYPDILIICGKPIFHEKRNDTIENPKLLIEVLSKSTEAKDRGEKFFAYQTLESVEEYVLVSQDKLLVEKFTKQNDGSWKYLATIGIESKVYFESVETELSLNEIYDLVEFE